MACNLAAILAAALSLSACVDTGLNNNEVGPKYALADMVTKQIRTCWFAKGEKDFSSYAAESDVNPIFKRARILLVPKNDLEAKPLLIIEAVNRNSAQASISSYGSLMQSTLSTRINADLNRWVSGSESCQ